MLRIIAMLLLVTVLISCAGNRVELGSDNKMQKADELYARGKFARAAVLYDEITYERRSANSAIALMRLADCYFQMNKFADARLKYTLMTNTYPDYPEIELAYFRIGVCYFEEALPPQYDQTETGQAIEAFRIFAEKFPNSPLLKDAIEYIRKAQYNLIEKKYYNGYIYFKMKDYSAALMYFTEIINLGNTDELDRRSLYYATRISIIHKNDEQANNFWRRLKDRYPNSRETRKLSRHF